jgi:hypothetical protein
MINKLISTIRAGSLAIILAMGFVTSAHAYLEFDGGSCSSYPSYNCPADCGGACYGSGGGDGSLLVTGGSDPNGGYGGSTGRCRYEYPTNYRVASDCTSKCTTAPGSDCDKVPRGTYEYVAGAACFHKTLMPDFSVCGCAICPLPTNP